MPASPALAPVPPLPLPPGRTVTVPERGEFFLRDTGGDGTPLLLVHGWMFPSDLNWANAYGPLERAGYRVLALDLRGHGRGLRSLEPFRLTDCADDAAAVLDLLDVPSALVVGYSMGGPVATLLARRRPDRVAGLVLCATAMNWKDPRQKAFWRTMGLLRLVLGAFPMAYWRLLVRTTGSDRQMRAWVVGELSRGSARDVAEAGRELGRFDSSPWLPQLRQPGAVVLTSRDRLVPPAHQRALAAALRVSPYEVAADHDACARAAPAFNAALLQALGGLQSAAARSA